MVYFCEDQLGPSACRRWPRVATINEDGPENRGFGEDDRGKRYPNAAANDIRELKRSHISPFPSTACQPDICENLYEINNKETKTKQIQTFTCPRNCEMEYRAYSEHPAPGHLSITILKDRIEAAKATWKKSGDCAELQQELLEHYDPDGTAANADYPTVVDCCVAFGLGSFSGVRHEADWCTSIEKLVCFLSTVEAINSRQPQKPPKVYAQDPLFDDLDRTLLSCLGITPVEHPTGFTTLTRDSLAFCPRPGPDDFRILARNPKVFIGHGLDNWIDGDGEGQLCSYFGRGGLTIAEEEKGVDMNMGTVSEEDHATFVRDGFVVVGDEDVADDDEQLRNKQAGQFQCNSGCDEHTAEFVKLFMENGRIGRRVPQTWGQSAFVIWRVDQAIEPR